MYSSSLFRTHSNTEKNMKEFPFYFLLPLYRVKEKIQTIINCMFMELSFWGCSMQGNPTVPRNAEGSLLSVYRLYFHRFCLFSDAFIYPRVNNFAFVCLTLQRKSGKYEIILKLKKHNQICKGISIVCNGYSL